MPEDSIKIAVLEQKLLDFSNIVHKLDEAISKLSDVNANIMKMLAVHDERIEQCNKSDNLILKVIDDAKEENLKDHKVVHHRIDDVEKILEKMEERLQDVSRIKWMTIGTGIVLAVLAAAFSTLASGWWTPSEMQVLREGHSHQQSVQPDQ
jgi:N-acetylmuramic acid 6-phosphate (MurNAc-6-P) etherase